MSATRAAAVSALHAHALRLLAARPQSRAELRLKLERVSERRRRRRQREAAASSLSAAAAAAAAAATREEQWEAGGAGDGAATARELAEAAIQRLEATSAALAPSEALVDDAAFASFWAAQRALHRPRSRFVLAGELRAKGVEPALVNGALSGHDERAAARAAARRGRAAGREGRALLEFVVRKGFAFREAQRAIAALDEGVDAAAAAAGPRGGALR